MRKLFSVLILLFLAHTSQAQFNISGKITNDAGEALIGASVFLKASDYATITDEQGRFELIDVERGFYKMKVTYIGYNSWSEDLDLNTNINKEITLAGSVFEIDQIQITANHFKEDAPFSYIDVEKEDIELKNLAQDIPFLLEHTPSMVVTSDAGAGIGYTGMRIRGSDASRINVTVNGVPLNDSESHGVFWVNMPDFSTSVDNIQIQRGVGQSTVGASAFGATVGLNTNKIHQNPFVRLDGTYGSFNTNKMSVSIGTGLMENAFTIEGRYSIIKSDGYIDRGSSDLNSWYFSAAKLGPRHSLRFNAFSGKERTYQAWNGVPEAKLFGTEEELITHHANNSNGDYNTTEDSLNLFNSDRSYNAYTYENQVDDYRQSHYQLIYSLKTNDKLSFNLTGHYTRGKGFFETFKFDEDFEDYNLPCLQNENMEEVCSSDLIRRKWLDNHFYGGIFNAVYQANDNLNLMLGAAVNRYDGDHFGHVPFAFDAVIPDPDFRYYDNNSIKDDQSIFIKADYRLSEVFTVFADLQSRSVKYTAEGLDDNGQAVNIDADYNFFNPKFGINYKLNDKQSIYFSYAKAQREPVRSDFVDAVGTGVPKPEVLNDFEFGFRSTTQKLGLEANVYYMKYKDQLVLTGALNDVGSPVRVNVDDSYRLGLELAANYQFSSRLTWRPNLTLSQNKISEFTDILYNYIPFEILETTIEDADIAFSPNIISGSRLSYKLGSQFEINWLSKYVGKQFLDNTMSEDKSIDPYWVNDLVISYDFSNDFLKQANFKLAINNLLDAKYVSNGYTYSYALGDVIQENYLYPQAGINFLASFSVSF